MKRHLVIIVGTVLVILAVGMFAVHLYDENKQEILSQIQHHQLSHAQNLAKQIETFFGNYSQLLQTVSSLGPSQQDGAKGMITYMQAHVKQQEKAIIKSASFYDEIGTMIYSTEGKMIRFAEGQSDFFPWAKKMGRNGRVFVSSPIFESGSPRFLLATPLYRDASDAKHSPSNGNFAGVVSLTIDLKEFLADQLLFSDGPTSLHQIWIMDRDGKLLFQSGHPEMVSRNIYQKDESCNQCHSSFHYVEKILKEKEGTVDYDLRNSPRKIAAFAPVNFENVSWTVVITSRYDEVEVFERKSLQKHLMLLGIVVLALAGASMLIVGNERLKVRAQEEAKHWREKRATEEALKESEKQLRHLSSQLLTVQETERRRISKELHDELGGALTVLKLRLSFIGKQLKEDQATVREECETLSGYIHQVIENVRRLSRDLTPSILEDVGLSAAIRWLITNSNKNYNIHTTLDVLDIDDIDRLFPQDAEIIIYRILQEALTNIGKHGQARNVSVVIKKHDDRVSFSVEDDGIGFDVPRSATVNPDDKGLGLTIMDERARMLKGSLEVWSEEGKGTRISFHIPLERGGNA
jgi:signal transduction histidine kinase